MTIADLKIKAGEAGSKAIPKTLADFSTSLNNNPNSDCPATITAINYDSGGTGTIGSAGAPGRVSPSNINTVGVHTYYFKVIDSKGTEGRYGPFNYEVECGSLLTISQIPGTSLSTSSLTIAKHPSN